MVKKSQMGVEYMIIIGFVTFAIISTLAIAIVYSGQTKDKIKLNQAESFSVQLINSAESVFFAGEPSKATISLYLPEGIADLNITTNYVVITISTSTGKNIISYKSKVPLNGTISSVEGIKRLTLEAKNTFVQIT